ncbi:hypothetical protein IWW38_003113 [Coemansia aciculifera]|uniref:Uncharacterized protein n=1 Tax=Coemansia aciculifera TaxID=417176 RepID=A0ACC1M1N7_9FUNG|nr:hypothetical protein IWW38_003113 [Coemansia aciculifera]
MITGSIHMCNDKDDDDNNEHHKESKQLQTASGAAVRPSGDGELNTASKHTSAGCTSQAKKEHAHHSCSLFKMYGNITWQFYVCPSDIGYDDVSSDDDKDHDALTAKVLLSKIHGGELIGLSPHLPTLSESTSSGIRPRTICCTGFGSNQVPILIFSELKPEVAVEAPTVAAAAAPTVVAASASVSVTSATTAPSVFAITKTSESAEPDSAGKSKTEEMAALAATPVPLFIFGKPAADEASEKLAAIATEKTATDATDNSSKVATALITPTMLTTPMFSPASVSAANNTPSVKGLDVTHHMSMTSAHVFSVQLATLATTNATGAAMGTAMPELAPKAVISVPTFLFGLSKPAADSASKPAATSGLFSFSAAAATLNATTTSAVIAGDKPKSEFKFSFGSLGAASTAGTQATLAAAGQLAQQMMFGQICAGASAASCKAPIILTAKQPRNDVASSSDAPAASKPKFNFGSSGATGSRFSLTSSASSALAFGYQSFNFTANPAFTLLTVNSTAPASSKPVGTFTFDSTAASATAPSGAGGGVGFTFTFGHGSMPHIQPVSMATTCSPSNGFGSTPVTSSFGGTTNNVPATSTSIFNFGLPFGGSGTAKPTAMPALTAFGGFGKGMMTLMPGTAAKMLVFSFDPAMPSPPSFGSSPVASLAAPAVPIFTRPATLTTTPACGPATPLAPSFGSGPVIWSTTSPFANPATSATTPACGPAMSSAPHFSFGPITLLTMMNIANLPVFFRKPAAATPKPLKSILRSNAPSFKPKNAVRFVSRNLQADAGVGCS